MKRSEMVSFINKFLEEYYYGTHIDIHDGEGILEIIERQGMLPPKIPKVEELSIHNMFNGIPMIAKIIEVNEWDEE